MGLSACSFSPSLLPQSHATTYGPTLGARFLTRDPLEAITRSPYGYVANNPLNMTDPSGLIGLPIHLPSLGDLWDGFTEQIGCGFQQLGSMLGEVWEHRVGALKVVSVGLAVTALLIAPATGGTSLAALPTLLGAGSIGSSVIAEAIDGKPGRGQRVTFALGLGILGGSVAGSFGEGGLAIVSLIMDALLIGGDFVEVGQPNPRYR